MTPTETALRNQISQLKKRLAGTASEWISEKEAMKKYGWSRSTAQNRRNEHPKGWKCEGGVKVDTRGRTVRSNIIWDVNYIETHIFKHAA